MTLYPSRGDGTVKAGIDAHGFKDVALLFFHGLGDTLMFRSLLHQMRAERPGVRFTTYLRVPGAQECLDDSVWWSGSVREGHDAIYHLDFPEPCAGETKTSMCARRELGLDVVPDELRPYYGRRRLACLHLISVSNGYRPSEAVARQIYDIMCSEGLLPIELHFEGKPYPWIGCSVAEHMPSVDIAYSLLAASAVNVLVLSAPVVMSLAIAPEKTIVLESGLTIDRYFTGSVRKVNTLSFDPEAFRAMLREVIG